MAHIEQPNGRGHKGGLRVEPRPKYAAGPPHSPRRPSRVISISGKTIAGSDSYSFPAMRGLARRSPALQTLLSEALRRSLGIVLVRFRLRRRSESELRWVTVCGCDDDEVSPDAIRSVVEIILRLALLKDEEMTDCCSVFRAAESEPDWVLRADNGRPMRPGI